MIFFKAKLLKLKNDFLALFIQQKKRNVRYERLKVNIDKIWMLLTVFRCFFHIQPSGAGYQFS